MSYRSERFNNGMRTIEEAANGIDKSKWRVLSDGVLASGGWWMRSTGRKRK